MLFSKQFILLSEIFGVDEEDPIMIYALSICQQDRNRQLALDLLDILADNHSLNHLQNGYLLKYQENVN